MIDVQSLAGGSDNIPGVPGIGIKLRQNLLINIKLLKIYSIKHQKYHKIKEEKLYYQIKIKL